MNIGWIGLGKLGLTCALVLEKHGGHKVVGYDPSSRPNDILRGHAEPPREEGIKELLAGSQMQVASTPAEVVREAEVIFVAVQTPHGADYGGEVPAPAEPRDFEYGYLVQAVRDLVTASTEQQKYVTIVVVSTCLPGTMNRLIRPLLSFRTKLVYNPAFIAMGTTVNDFLNPEFVLLGADDADDAIPVAEVYRTLHDRPRVVVSVESAELTKIAYNVVISAKIVIGNTLMEIADKTGADCDQVIDALSLATDRVLSPKYLRGGMGDGGHCHPRDLIAMCWLTNKLDLSSDTLCTLARAREQQSGWLADLAEQWADMTLMDIHILGKAYKPESDLTGGSPALLLAHQLRERGRRVDHWDPFVDGDGGSRRKLIITVPGVYVIGTKHASFAAVAFPQGSVVIDPHGYIPDQLGVSVVRIGRKS